MTYGETAERVILPDEHPVTAAEAMCRKLDAELTELLAERDAATVKVLQAELDLMDLRAENAQLKATIAAMEGRR